MRKPILLPRLGLSRRDGAKLCAGLAAALLAFNVQAGEIADSDDASAPAGAAEFGLSGQGTSSINEFTGAFTHNVAGARQDSCRRNYATAATFRARLCVV